MVTIHPVGSMILVEPETKPETTKSGLIIPDSAKERPARAKVLEVPTKLETVVKPGDTIFFPPNALKQFVVDDQLHSAVAEENIYCYETT